MADHDTEHRKLHLLIHYSKVEINNIKIILEHHSNEMDEKERNGYLDRLTDARRKIQRWQRLLRRNK